MEKSRVVFQNEGEQNFHIFYYLLIGLKDQNEKYFLLDDSSNDCVEYIKFNYLNRFVYDNFKNDEYIQTLNEKFDELINAMNYVAFMETVRKLKEIF